MQFIIFDTLHLYIWNTLCTRSIFDTDQDMFRESVRRFMRDTLYPLQVRHTVPTTGETHCTHYRWDILYPLCTDETYCTHYRWDTLYPLQVRHTVPTTGETHCTSYRWDPLYPLQVRPIVPTTGETHCTHYLFFFFLHPTHKYNFFSGRVWESWRTNKSNLEGRTQTLLQQFRHELISHTILLYL